MRGQYWATMRRIAACIMLLSAVSSVASLKHHIHDAASFTPDITLRLARKELRIGGISRYSTLINGSLPGPTIRIPEDKVVWIRVYNDIKDDNVTMHWHGLALAAYPFSDGTPLASQWPIPPDHFFDYELKTANGTAGTYYYHSHVGFQAVTATGPLIVEDSAPPPYPSDGERIVFLQEFWRQTDLEVLKGLQATPHLWTGDALLWLVNGRTADDEDGGMDVIEVDPGKTYRFRFVAATALSLAMFAFEDHDRLEIIQADGHYTKPHAVHLMQMGSGQRYDALVRTKSCDELRRLGKGDFAMQVESRERDSVITGYAMLHYRDTCGLGGWLRRLSTRLFKTSAEPAPLQLPATISNYLDYALELLTAAEGRGFPSAAEVTRRVVLHMQEIQNLYYLWLVNDVWTEDGGNPLPHTTPSEPYLVSLYRNQTARLPDYEAAVARGGQDPRTKAYPARLGEVLEIVLQQYAARSLVDAAGAGNSDTHPWHAHGSHFWDAGGGAGAWTAERAERQLAGSRPVRRDTTLLYRHQAQTRPGAPAGWRVWRLRVDQPGVCMVHCHTLQHMIQGLQTVWVHGEADDILRAGAPDLGGYLDFGGDAYGNGRRAPRVVHFHELD